MTDAAVFDLMFFVALYHVEIARSARLVSSLEGATVSASNLDFRGTIKSVFADDTKQATGRKQFSESHSFCNNMF